MTRSRLLLLGSIALATGCATNSRRAKLQNEAALASENHEMWTRPTEVGFKMGDEISATAKATKVLWMNTGESKVGGVSLSIVSGLSGTGASLSQTGQFAAYKAVTGAGVEGIYVTRVESENKGIFPFWRNETVTVYGRALTIDNYGPVDEDRADKWRFRRFGPKTVVVKEGRGTGVNVNVD